MTKEQLLESLKTSILTLRDKGKELATNKEMFKAWQKETHTINEEVQKLNSCDMLYLNDEYSKWFKENIQPEVDKLPEVLKRQHNWI